MWVSRSFSDSGVNQNQNQVVAETCLHIGMNADVWVMIGLHCFLICTGEPIDGEAHNGQVQRKNISIKWK